jgi:hypothetical protein
MSIRIEARARGTGAAVIAALLLVACQDAEPAGPARSEIALKSQAGGVACFAKKTLSERLEFASADRASKILQRPSEWARQLSAFDRGARMLTLEPTTMQSFLAFAGDAALAWSPAEEAYWATLVERLSDAAAGLNPRLPHVFMVKTTGLEEFGAAYARNQAMMFPQSRLAIAGDERRDFFLLAHELFHILTRENAAMREALYALLGFERFAKFDYPGELEGRRLSNPDAYSYEHALAVQTPDGPRVVVPVIQSRISLEELLALPPPVNIFSVLDIVLLPVDTGSGDVLRDGSGELIRYGFGNTSWVPQMLRNSSYIIHPEELLADNFALLMEWRSSGVVPATTPGGFPVNDVALLTAIEDVLTQGCGG